ncbi:MAG: 5-(carboxyamino)imidazole ribonucleotide synthase [Alphaproteobacteria bacterium]|nr:5-(carboxyamino)imidazole ribonucleotide synthase [Alphaproteobacteria bacterium]
MTIIPPGKTVGILGGGQLGRMLAIAAARLGYATHVYCPDPDSPAFAVASRHSIARYEDADALRAFAASVAVVTYEFENVPAATAEVLARAVPARPNARALAVAQDRVAEKEFARAIGANTTAYARIAATADLPRALDVVGLPAVLKTNRLGYDGKGQRRIERAAELEPSWLDLDGVECILEAFSPFTKEISVIVARAVDGSVAAFDVPENHHEGGILRTSRVPATVGGAAVATAQDIAHRLAAALDYVGVLAVEMFAMADGTILVNEMAPRVHNSGHWTIDACITDQFEQHIRAICGLPLGSPARHSDAEMINLIGQEVEQWADFARDPMAKLHLYGKAAVRPGRKMGHVTRLRPLSGPPRRA